MAWTITERFPSWGEAGEFPADGFFYDGGDQVNEKHLDALWNGVDGLEEDIQAALNDIDSNADGIVDKADNGASGFTFDGGATLNGLLNMSTSNAIQDAGVDAITFDGSQNIGIPNGNITSVGSVTRRALSSDPSDPSANQHTIWQSDGTGTGDDGDIMIKITDSGGTTKTAKLADFTSI